MKWYASDITYTYVTPVEKLITPERNSSVFSRPLTVDELLELSKDPSYELSEEAAHYIEAEGQHCYATFNNGIVSAYMYMATGDIDPKYNNPGAGFGGYGFRLPSNVLYVYKGFALPDYRGQSQVGITITEGAKALVKPGGWLVTTVDVGNHSSIRMMEKLGFQRHNKCREYRLLNRRKYFISDAMNLGGLADRNHKRVELFY